MSVSCSLINQSNANHSSNLQDRVERNIIIIQKKLNV